MIVVDTSALVAIAAGEPEAKRFSDAIADAVEAVVGAPTALEFFMVTHGERLKPANEKLSLLFTLTGFRIVAWSNDHLALAQSAFLRFGKGRHPAKLNFGDCMSYALAKSLDAPLLFKGGDFALTDVRVAAEVPPAGY